MNHYVDDSALLDVEGVEDSMGACDHPLIYGNEHEILMRDDAVKLGVVVGVNAFRLPIVVLLEEVHGLLLGLDGLRGEEGAESSQEKHPLARQ